MPLISTFAGGSTQGFRSGKRGGEPPGSSTINAESYGTVYQPNGYLTVTVTLYGTSGGKGMYDSAGTNQYNAANGVTGGGTRVVATNVPVSGLKIYTSDSTGTRSNFNVSLYGGGYGGGASYPYRGGAGGAATIAVNTGNSVILVAGGGGGDGHSYFNGEGGGSAGSGTVGGAGTNGGCYYGGGGGGGGIVGGAGAQRRYTGIAGTSTTANASVTVTANNRFGKGYAVISWG